MQNFMKPSAAVHELSIMLTEKKNSDENNTVHRYRADGNKTNLYTSSAIIGLVLLLFYSTNDHTFILCAKFVQREVHDHKRAFLGRCYTLPSVTMNCEAVSNYAYTKLDAASAAKQPLRIVLHSIS